MSKLCCLITSLQVAALGEGVSLEAKLLSRYVQVLKSSCVALFTS